jgi:plasmid stability protein
MALVGLQLDDDLYTRLRTRAIEAGRTPEAQMALLLKIGVDLCGLDRTVVLDSAALATLEPILGGGSVLNTQDLVKKVERLAGVSFRHVRLPFTPNQLEQLQEKAARAGLTVDQLVERTANKMYEAFFGLVPV